jgi:hypothetical protein
VRWRDREGKKRFRDLNTTDPDVAELERQLTQQREEGRAGARLNITADAREALKRFLTHLGLTRSQKTVRFYERLSARAPCDGRSCALRTVQRLARRG